MGQTLVEKIISEHAGKNVHAGELVISRVDVAAVQDGTGPLMVQEFKKLGLNKLKNPERSILFIDQASPSPRKELSNTHLVLREFAKEYGAVLSDTGAGVCHQRLIETFVNPGEVLVAADSHTCTSFLHDFLIDLNRFIRTAPASDQQTLAVNKDIRNFFPCAVVNCRDRGAGDTHSGSAGFLCEAFVIQKP